jgi:hypothetical protein
MGKRPMKLGSVRSRRRWDATKGAGIPKPAATSHIRTDEARSAITRSEG